MGLTLFATLSRVLSWAFLTARCALRNRATRSSGVSCRNLLPWPDSLAAAVRLEAGSFLVDGALAVAWGVCAVKRVASVTLRGAVGIAICGF